jgi:N-acetylmuramoyl-L-alanine amidase
VSSEAEVTPGSFGEKIQEFSGGAFDAAEYRSLAQGGDLRIRKVFGLGVRTIMIDPGHGGESATGAIGKDRTLEKSINLDIARKLKAVLERDTDYRILMIREDDRDVPLKNRVRLANEAKADLFVSIHVNALSSNPIDIIETYYFGPSRDKKTLELAAEVNEGSDYSYSEYNEIIKQISNQLKYQESRRLARSIQETLYQNMKKRKADVLDFGVKRAPFVVLLGVEMPAVLVEVACLSNEEEESRLKDAVFRQSIAGYIETGIIRYLDDNRKRSRSS